MTDQNPGSAAATLAGGQPGAAGAGGTPSPAATPWYGDTHRELVGAKGWKSPDDVLTSYRGLETLLGADKANRGVVLPKDENDRDGYNALWNRLGRPETPDKYTIPEALRSDPMALEFAKQAHGAGLTGKQFDDTMKWYIDAATKLEERQQAEFRAKVDADVDKLKTEWGGAWDAKIEQGRRAARQFGASAEQITAIEEKLGSAWVYKFFADIGAKLGEDAGVPAGQAGGTGFAMTPDQAHAAIGKLWSEKGAELTDSNHPGHKAAHDELERLYKIKAARAPATA